MQVDPNQLIDRMGQRIAQLSTELAATQLYAEELQRQLAEAGAEASSEPEEDGTPLTAVQ